MKRGILTLFCLALGAALALCACTAATPTPTPRPRPTRTPIRIESHASASPSADTNKQALAGMPVQPEPPTPTPSPRPSDTPKPNPQPTTHDAGEAALSEAPPAELVEAPPAEPVEAPPTEDTNREGLSGLPVFMRPTPSDIPESGDASKERLFAEPVPVTPVVEAGPPPIDTPGSVSLPEGPGAALRRQETASAISRDVVRRILADKESLHSVPVFLRPRAALLPASCGLRADEPRPAIGLRISDRGATVCLAGFPGDQTLTVSLFAPAGQLVAEEVGRVAPEDGPIAVMEVALDLPAAERTGVWRVVVQLPEETIEREISVQG
jgi:hypothetical protein